MGEAVAWQNPAGSDKTKTAPMVTGDCLSPLSRYRVRCLGWCGGYLGLETSIGKPHWLQLLPLCSHPYLPSWQSSWRSSGFLAQGELSMLVHVSITGSQSLQDNQPSADLSSPFYTNRRVSPWLRRAKEGICGAQSPNKKLTDLHWHILETVLGTEVRITGLLWNPLVSITYHQLVPKRSWKGNFSGITLG